MCFFLLLVEGIGICDRCKIFIIKFSVIIVATTFAATAMVLVAPVPAIVRCAPSAAIMNPRVARSVASTIMSESAATIMIRAALRSAPAHAAAASPTTSAAHVPRALLFAMQGSLDVEFQTVLELHLAGCARLLLLDDDLTAYGMAPSAALDPAFATLVLAVAAVV